MSVPKVRRTSRSELTVHGLEVAANETSGTKNPNPSVFEIGFGGGQSRVKSLPRVTPTIAQRHATVFACCNNIAGDLSKVPLRLFQRDAMGVEKPVFEHDILYFMNVESAPQVSAVMTRMNLVYSFCLRGRGHAYAPRNGAGSIELIEWISPDAISMLRNGRDRFFEFQDGAEIQRRVRSSSMVNLRYLPQDGWTGRSPIEVAGESIGLALAGQEAAARTASGGTLRAVMKMADVYESGDDFTRNARRIKASLTDPEANGIPIIGPDDSIDSLDISAADQELLASRKFDREQIAALYRMPPSKLQMLEFGVKANGQQQALDYRTDCLLHWAGPVEAEYGLGLLTASEREAGLVFRHDYSAMLVPTTKEHFDALHTAVGGPFMTANTAQRSAGLPVTDGPDDNRLNPASNMTREAESTSNEGEDSDDT